MCNQQAVASVDFIFVVVVVEEQTQVTDFGHTVVDEIVSEVLGNSIEERADGSDGLCNTGKDNKNQNFRF